MRSFAQSGGGSHALITTLPTNPRSAGLAGNTISLNDGDVSQFVENPALLSNTESGNYFLGIYPYVSNINVTNVSLSFNIKKYQHFGIGFTYLSHGNFDKTNALGVNIGTFTANDLVFILGKGFPIMDNLDVGINAKFVRSGIENYQFSSLLFDVGIDYKIKKNWNFALVLKNIGGSISNNFGDLKTSLFDIRLGTSFHPTNMPIRFTLTSSNVVTKNFEKIKSKTTVQKLFRKINIGLEFLISKKINLLLGYSSKNRQDFTSENKLKGFSGFSMGGLLKIKNFEIRYARVFHQIKSGSDYFSFLINLSKPKNII